MKRPLVLVFIDAMCVLSCPFYLHHSLLCLIAFYYDIRSAGIVVINNDIASCGWIVFGNIPFPDRNVFIDVLLNE